MNAKREKYESLNLDKVDPSKAIRNFKSEFKPPLIDNSVLSFDSEIESEIDFDIKLVCFKSKNWIGNGQLIPAGPMREKISSLKRFDAVEFGLGNLHVVDYSLFWGSIRENVKLRLNEYLKKQN